MITKITIGKKMEKKLTDAINIAWGSLSPCDRVDGKMCIYYYSFLHCRQRGLMVRRLQRGDSQNIPTIFHSFRHDILLGKNIAVGMQL